MNIPKDRIWLLILFVGAIWLGIGAADWALRFYWFHWHRQLMWQNATVVDSPMTPLAVRKEGALAGGNLTRLIGIPDVAREFECVRPPFVEYSDEFGFPNKPPTTNTQYSIVMTGDSFMMSPDQMNERMDAQLTQLSGVPVYNHSVKGWGPFHGMVRFLLSKRFMDRPPKVLVYGLLEQDISGGSYVSLLYRLKVRDQFADNHDKPSILSWGEFAPRRLSKSLLSTSLAAQLSRRLWNYARYYVFRQVTPDVVIGVGTVERHRMLFYRYALEAMHWPKATRNIPQVIWVLKQLDEICRERGISLVILLIPDKEQVYKEMLPARWTPVPDSCLNELDAGLSRQGVISVNLLPVFREQAQLGRLLYWPDDTHWNGAAIRMATELLWAKIQPLLIPAAPDHPVHE